MSINVPNPSGSAHTVSHATVVLIDALTGLPVGVPGSTPQPVTGALTDAQLRAAPVIVIAGQITTVAAAIANGASVSGDIDLGTARLGRIAMPAAWTSADLTLQTSFDGIAWNNLYDKDGSEYAIKADAARSVLIPLSDMLSVRYLRIRSGTSATPVAQVAARSLVLVLVP